MFTRSLTRLVIPAIASVTLLLAATTGATAAPSSSQQVRVISSCTAAKYKPSNYIFACADANTGMRHASYDWWTTHTAHGTATFYYNDCTPNCAAGQFHRLHAEFTLFRVRNTAKFGPLFTRADVNTRQGHQIYDLPTSTL